MKHVFALVIFWAVGAQAVDDYNFTCDIKSDVVKSIPGMKKAPEHPVVGLKIKVLKKDVPLYLIKVQTNTVEKNIFVTDWVAPSALSQDGLDLLQILSMIMGIDISNLEYVRAGLPTDLLDSFAYLELKSTTGAVDKIGFDGMTSYICQ